MFEDAPEGLQKYCPFICLSCVGFAAFIMGNCGVEVVLSY